MKLEVTELGPVKRAVRIEVPAEDVAKRFRDVYADLRSQVHIPGFRPGKAPLALLEKRYAKAVEDDVVRSLVPEYYQKAMKQAGFTPVAVDLPPMERLKIKDGAPLVFTTTVEIKPVFELREYKGITLKQDKRAITEEELDKAMQVLRQQHAQIEVVKEDRGVVEGDYVQVRIEQVEGPNQPAGFKPESHLFRVGDKTQDYGLALAEAGLGRKKGEAIRAGQDVIGTAMGMVRTLKQKVLPELDDAVPEYGCRQMARALQVDVAEVVKMLRDGGEDAVEDLKSRILTEKALQFVYEKAIIQV